jgi:hypothetical protein
MGVAFNADTVPALPLPTVKDAFEVVGATRIATGNCSPEPDAQDWAMVTPSVCPNSAKKYRWFTANSVAIGRNSGGGGLLLNRVSERPAACCAVPRQLAE